MEKRQPDNQAENDVLSPHAIPREAWIALAARFDWSVRETQIAQLLCDHHAAKQIARSLDISENTVHTHIRRLYQKMNVKSRPAFSSMIFKVLLDMAQRRDLPGN